MRLGQQINTREKRLMWLEDQNDKLRKQLSRMRSPPQIETRIKELNLGLLPPQPVQVWRLPEPGAEVQLPSAERPLALHTSHAPPSP